MAAISENPNPPHEPRHRALAQGRPGIRIRTIGNICPGDELMICNYSYKRQTRAPYCALYSSPRQRTVGTPPALPARKPGLKSASPAGGLLSLVWACPRPERFPIPYLHVMNNNTQGKILYYTVPRIVPNEC